MPMNLKTKREEAGLSQEKLAKILDLTQSQISRHEDDPENIPAGLLMRWLAALGTSLTALEAELESSDAGLDVGDPLAALWARLELLQDFCAQEDLGKATVAGLPGISEFRDALNSLKRKPNVVLTGRYDAGKSRMINTLMGQSNLPTKRQPATRIVTHVRHVIDRPAWMTKARDEVWVFRRGIDLDALSDESATRAHLLTSGNLETLREYGAYGGKHEAVAEAELALVFSDAPVLRACNFIDLPGFRGDERESETDAARAKTAFPLIDILVYASNATGFLDGVDFSFLGYLLRSLPAYESVEPSFPTLGNVFIVATHAYKTISDRELANDVLKVAAERMFRHFEGTVLHERSQMIGRPITLEDLQKRFFGFLAESEPRRRAFQNELKDLLSRRVPISQRKVVSNRVADFKREGTETVRQQLAACERMLGDLDAAKLQYQTLLGQEEARRRAANAKSKAVLAVIEKLAEEGVSATGQLYASMINADAVEKLIRKQYSSATNGKDEAKKFAASFVLENLQAAVGEKNAQLAKQLEQHVSEFVRGYQTSAEGFGAQKGGPIPLEIPFDAKGAFVGGIGATGAIGALSFWAASLGNLGAYIIAGKAVSLLAALGISIPGGTAAVMAFIAAIGGPVTVAVGVFAAAGALLWTLFGESWERRLSKKIVDSLHERALLSQLNKGVVDYWKETSSAFARGAARMEEEFQLNLKRYESLLKQPESSRKELEARLSQLEGLAGFFERIPNLPP